MENNQEPESKRQKEILRYLDLFSLQITSIELDLMLQIELLLSYYKCRFVTDLKTTAIGLWSGSTSGDTRFWSRISRLVIQELPVLFCYSSIS